MEKLTKYDSFEELKRQAMEEPQQTSAVALEKFMDLLRKRLVKKSASGKRTA